MHEILSPRLKPIAPVCTLQGSALIAVGLGVAAAGFAGKQNPCKEK